MKKLFFLLLLCCIATSYAQNVNQFTGSFSYDFPLLNIPSNRGAPTAMHASYNAGIQMNQPASEIGLGWSLDAGGAIYRSVSGIPDDFRDATGYLMPKFTSTVIDAGQGALYPEYNSTVTAYDIITTKRGLDTTQFTFPSFDSYFLTAPGLTGQLKLNYYNFYGYRSFTNVVMPHYPNGGTAYRRPQFHMGGDFADTLTSRHYSTTITGTTSFLASTATLTGNGFTNSAEPFVGRHLNGTVVTNQNFDVTTGRLATSNLIEYFTNAEIHAASVGGFSAAANASLSALNNFVDYQATHTRTSNGFPADGIGAFRVTGSNGLTYHYSLPVYELENTTYMIPLNPDYSLPGALTTTVFSASDTDPFPGGSKLQLKQLTRNMFAIKWLLTAITGPDYVDSNNNHQVDDSDAGYWISYDYQQWSSSFVSRYPQYGYDFTYQPDETSKEWPYYFPYTGAYCKVSGIYGTVSVKKTELYYLNKVRTASHTAILVRDVRYDEKMGDAAVTHTNSSKPNPELKVQRVVLFKNTELDSILSAYPTVSLATSQYTSSFSFTAVNNPTNASIYFENWWSSMPGKYCVLKHVEFDQDYSLCKKYYGNVNVDCNSSSVLMSPSTVQTSLTVGTNSISGKLTLNRILVYDFANTKVVPSTKFDYSANSSTCNPNYDLSKTDYWGYYKSDVTSNAYSRYTTKTSKNFTKAWSLLKITDPLGGITEMEYESNSYNRVLDVEATLGVRGPAFIYRIASIPTETVQGVVVQTYSAALEEGYSSPNLLTEFNYLKSDSIANLKTRISIPFVQAIGPISGEVEPSGNSKFTRSFANGPCTFTVYSGNSFNYNIAVTTPTGTYYRATQSIYLRKYTGYDNLPLDGVYSSSISGVAKAAYGGNGFLMFETPVGYTAYGNGIRVKKIKLYNSPSEVYVKEYTYEDGVATNEADRFEYPRYKRDCAGSAFKYGYLEAKEYSPFDMGAYIGYSKVTLKDLGQINTANGKVETYFLTDPLSNGALFKSNFLTSTYTSTSSVGGSTFVVNTINECVNKFASAFGQVLGNVVYDKNNNVISSSGNEYTTSTQGATSELFYFDDPSYAYTNGFSAAISNTVNILRHVPVVLKRSTSYGLGGTFEKSETIGRDEITGETVSSQSSGKNNSSSISYKVPAYKYYQATDNITYTNTAFRTVLPLSADMYSYGNIDSTLTSGSFLTAGYRLFSKTMKQRQLSGNIYVTNTATLPSYFNNRSFIFDAGAGSMNNYGLFDKSALSSNTLNLAASTSSLYWEPSTTYNWRLINEVTLLDPYKNVLEVRDANKRFSASRFGYNGFYKTASVSNCNYASFTYAGFETVATGTGSAMMDGDIQVNDHTLIPSTTITPHSGMNCIKITSLAVSFIGKTEKSTGNTLDIGFMPGRIYRASVWTHTTNSANAVLYASVTGTINDQIPYSIFDTYSASVATNSVTQIGNWILIQIDITIPENYSNGQGSEFRIELQSANSSTVYFDDFILHPVESAFEASVYNPRNGRLMSNLDANGLATNYFYDAAGRITEIWKEIPSVGYKKIKKSTYNYARGAND